MFPYYLLPNVGDTHKPDAEEEQESKAPLAVDSAVQDYENNLYHRLGFGARPQLPFALDVIELGAAP